MDIGINGGFGGQLQARVRYALGAIGLRLPSRGKGQARCSPDPSKLDPPVATLILPGLHMVPADATALIVKFFKKHLLMP